MTDLYHPSLPYAQDRARRRAAADNKMLGITRTPARELCISCEKYRTAETGIRTDAGSFICGMCARPRRVG